MEHVRLIIAIVLSLLVFVAWDFLFVDRRPVPPAKPPVETAEPTAKPEPPATDHKPTLSLPAEPAGQTARTIRVETGLYTAHITERGAAIQQFVLKEYKEHSGAGAPLKALIPESNAIGSAIVGLAEDPVQAAQHLFAADYAGERLRVGDNPESLTFRWKSEKGILLEKTYTFEPGSYQIGMTVRVINQSGGSADPELRVTMANPPPDKSDSYSFQGPFVFVDRDLKEIDAKDIGEESVYSGTVLWAGIEEHYFLTTLIPEAPVSTRVEVDASTENDLLFVTYAQPPARLAPGASGEYEYLLFFGPKRMHLLREIGHNLDHVVDFGWFGFIAKPCLWLMNAIHDNVIANYGVAIILLTLLFKLIFWPLGNKSYKSMAEMKKLQPLMADIRKRYQNDKRKMNEEMMQLYRTYKVNPMSGCLPMLVQIPVFIAFYRMLYGAIELRHAPFLLWINDLSAPDRLFRFDLTIPFMAPPYGIPVLTIIMGATMFIQQKLSPPPGDPSQAKFMMMMPLIFTVIFINFPSGLVLYWLVNNIVSIAQQYYITRKTV